LGFVQDKSFTFDNTTYINTVGLDLLMLCDSDQKKCCKIDSLFGYDHFSPEKLRCLKKADLLINPYNRKFLVCG